MTDTAALARTHAACFPPGRIWSAHDFSGLIDTPGTALWGDGNAFLLGRIIAGEAEVLTLAVAPAQQRQGHARRLLAQFLADAAAQGATTAFLEVAADNEPAIALYAQAGFVPAGLRRRYYPNAVGTRTDAHVLRRDLTPVQRNGSGRNPPQQKDSC